MRIPVRSLSSRISLIPSKVWNRRRIQRQWKLSGQLILPQTNRRRVEILQTQSTTSSNSIQIHWPKMDTKSITYFACFDKLIQMAPSIKWMRHHEISLLLRNLSSIFVSLPQEKPKRNLYPLGEKKKWKPFTELYLEKRMQGNLLSFNPHLTKLCNIL